MARVARGFVVGAVLLAASTPTRVWAWADARLREYEATLRVRRGAPSRVTLDVAVEILGGRLTGFDLGMVEPDARIDLHRSRVVDDERRKVPLTAARSKNGMLRLDFRTKRGLRPGIARVTLVYETDLAATAALSPCPDGSELRWAAPSWDSGMFRALLRVALPVAPAEVRIPEEPPCEVRAVDGETIVECEKIRPPPLFALGIDALLPRSVLGQSDAASAGVPPTPLFRTAPPWRGRPSFAGLAVVAILGALITLRIRDTRRIGRRHGRVVRFLVPLRGGVPARLLSVAVLVAASAALEARAGPIGIEIGAILVVVAAFLCLARWVPARAPSVAVEPSAPYDPTELVSIDRRRLRTLRKAHGAAWRSSFSLADGSTPLGFAVLLVLLVGVAAVARWAPLGADPRARAIVPIEAAFALVAIFAALPRRSLGPLSGADEIVPLVAVYRAARRTLGRAGAQVEIVAPPGDVIAPDLRVCIVRAGRPGTPPRLAQIEVALERAPEALGPPVLHVWAWLDGARDPIARPGWVGLDAWIASLFAALARPAPRRPTDPARPLPPATHAARPADQLGS